MRRYEIANEIFESGNYLDAFEAFKKIALDENSSAEDKSDAFNMMGAIVLIDTRVEFVDESGLEYFTKSLAVDPFNVGALLNIIEGFGLSVNNHQNIDALESAIRTLQETNYTLTYSDKEMIHRKRKISAPIRGKSA